MVGIQSKAMSGSFRQWEGANYIMAILSFFFSFFRLNSRNSLTMSSLHIKLGRKVEFGDAQKIGLNLTLLSLAILPQATKLGIEFASIVLNL